mmetsp:Transcript_10380/g.16609  ORF Transcript_10380/g.16609 Transcript_10380/m.16609 type:complete len:85 (+) Transcript_10380:302-556(+)
MLGWTVWPRKRHKHRAKNKRKKGNERFVPPDDLEDDQNNKQNGKKYMYSQQQGILVKVTKRFPIFDCHLNIIVEFNERTGRKTT